MEPLRFEATLDSPSGGPVKIPFDIRELFGRSRPPVLVTVNGHTYPSTVAVYGGEYYVPLNRANAAAAGVVAGQPVAVTVQWDEQERSVVVPADLAAALDEAGVRDQWDRLSYSHQREHVNAIDEAKRPETRARRITKAVDMVGRRGR
jgi:hypothetical protein